MGASAIGAFLFLIGVITLFGGGGWGSVAMILIGLSLASVR
jgi:hypothetical protein